VKKAQLYFEKFKRLRTVRKARILLSKLILPGFDGMPLLDVGRFFVNGLLKGSLTMRASAVSFSFFLALFPLVLFFFTLIPYLPIPNFQDTLMETLKNLMPHNAFMTVQSTVEDIITRQRGSLLSIGFLMALYFSTSGVKSIMDAFKMSYHYVETRTFFREQLISLILVLVLSILLITAVLLITVGTLTLNYLESREIIRDSLVINMIIFGKWVVIVALISFGISFLYYFAPSYRKRFRFFSAGSSLATLMFILASIGFNYYINNFARYNALYGSIGTLIVFLMWIYFINIVLLIGFELNVSIRNAKKWAE
jgi:membrane protein